MDKDVGIGEVIALAKAFGSGGGSSGGGVLVVHMDSDTGTLDKTWQEIHDAALTGIVIIVINEGDQIILAYVGGINISGSEYQVGTTTETYFIASSADGYPVYVDA